MRMGVDKPWNHNGRGLVHPRFGFVSFVDLGPRADSQNARPAYRNRAARDDTPLRVHRDDMPGADDPISGLGESEHRHRENQTKGTKHRTPSETVPSSGTT